MGGAALLFLLFVPHPVINIEDGFNQAKLGQICAIQRAMHDVPFVQPCGGAIPLCMIGEFDLPMEIVDRKVTKMKMISPSNREVDVGKTLSEREYIGMCRREVRRSCCPQPAGKPHTGDDVVLTPLRSAARL